jgi:hypothetical protein
MQKMRRRRRFDNEPEGGSLMKKLVLAAVATVALAAPVAATADPASNDYCGASANGCAHSQTNTICAGHGAFGPGNDWRGGASGDNGDNTAYSNSTLCGNPQGAAGVDEPGI